MTEVLMRTEWILYMSKMRQLRLVLCHTQGLVVLYLHVLIVCGG